MAFDVPSGLAHPRHMAGVSNLSVYGKKPNPQRGSRSTKFPWGASDLKGHRQGVREDIPHPLLDPIKTPTWRPPCLRKRAASGLTGLWDTKLSGGKHARRLANINTHTIDGTDWCVFVKQNRVWGALASQHAFVYKNSFLCKNKFWGASAR